MPWKERYTISDEVGLADHEVHWPNGARCSVQITVDLSPAAGTDGIAARDLHSPEAVFGRGEGLDGLVDLLRRHGLRATFAVPGVLAPALAERLRALRAAGHEVAANGLRHEDVSGLARADEAARLAETTALIAEAAGERPSGWFSLPRQGDPFAVGTVSRHTIDLLIEAGYRYYGNGLADDIPHYWVCDFERRRAILALPYYYHFDDQFFLMFPREGTGLEHADALAANWRAELTAQYRRGRMFHMVLHPYAIGWAHRLQYLDDFLASMTAHPGLWNATGAECAEWWLATFPAETCLKLEPSIWQDRPGSLS